MNVVITQKIKKQHALPSVFTRTLGKATIFLFTGKMLRRVHLLRHSAKFKTLPSARRVAIGKEQNFAECQCGSTRQSSKLRRVLPAWHSAKFESLPSATRLALGKVSNFAECLSKCTRRSLFPVNRKIVALPSVWVKTLCKACCFFIYSVYCVITTFIITNTAYIHSKHLIQHI